MDDSRCPVRVHVRVRPYVRAYEKDMETGEVNAGVQSIVMMSARPASEAQSSEGDPAHGMEVVDPLRVEAPPRKFHFHRCYNSFAPSTHEDYASQKAIWDEVGAPAVKATLDGISTCIIAYGETGSGKSKTLGFGTFFDGSTSEDDTCGMLPRFSKALFRSIEAAKASDPRVSISVEVRMVQLYEEEATDLLSASSEKLLVREHARAGVYIRGLSRSTAADYASLVDLLQLGFRARASRAITANLAIHRSHLGVEIIVTRSCRIDKQNTTKRESIARFWEIGGSERAQALLGARTDRLYSQALVNTSIESLHRIVGVLQENELKHVHNPRIVPYRSSLLTLLLKQCLAPNGNCQTSFIACIAPSNLDYEETVRTLQFSSRLLALRTRAYQVEDGHTNLVRGIRAEADMLRSHLESIDRKIDENDASEPSQKIKLTKVERERMDEEKRKIAEKLQAGREAMQLQLKEDLALLEDWTVDPQERIRQSEARLDSLRLWLSHRGSKYPGTVAKRKQQKSPHLASLHPDPSVAGSLVHFLNNGETLFGRLDSGPGSPVDVILEGLKIEKRHCQISMQALSDTEYEVVLHVTAKAAVSINGKRVSSNSPTILKHGDKVLLGDHHLFIMSMGTSAGSPLKVVGTDIFESAVRLSCADTLRSLTKEQRAIRKRSEDDLESVSSKLKDLERELLLEKRRVKSKGVTGKKAEKARKRVQHLEAKMGESATELSSMREALERGMRDQKLLESGLISLIPCAKEATAIARAIKCSLKFEIILIINKGKAKLALHDDDGLKRESEVELWVRVQPSGKYKRGSGAANPYTAVWNRDKFLNRLYQMRKMFMVFVNVQRSVEELRAKHYNLENDPFYDSVQHQLVGSSLMYMDSLSYFLEFEDLVPVIDYRGEQVGSLSVKVVPKKCGEKKLTEQLIDDAGEMHVRDHMGQLYEFAISIRAGKGLPKGLCCNLFVSFSVPVHGDQRVYETEKCGDDTQNPIFHHATTFVEEVTDELCEFFAKEAISLEVYGAPSGTGRSIEEENEGTSETKERDAASEARAVADELSFELSNSRIELAEAQMEASEMHVEIERLKDELKNAQSSTSNSQNQSQKEDRLEAALQEATEKQSKIDALEGSLRKPRHKFQIRRVQCAKFRNFIIRCFLLVLYIYMIYVSSIMPLIFKNCRSLPPQLLP